jgi:hypothetical protein
MNTNTSSTSDSPGRLDRLAALTAAIDELAAQAGASAPPMPWPGWPAAAWRPAGSPRSGPLAGWRPTDLATLALLGRAHHRAVHEGAGDCNGTPTVG